MSIRALEQPTEENLEIYKRLLAYVDKWEADNGEINKLERQNIKPHMRVPTARITNILTAITAQNDQLLNDIKDIARRHISHFERDAINESPRVMIAYIRHAIGPVSLETKATQYINARGQITQ